jgi:hypothetical protein
MHARSILCLIALVSLGGCATVGRDLTESGEVSVRRSPSKLVNIQAVTVRQDGDHLVVRGVVRRAPLTNAPVWGHVKVTAFDEAGQNMGHAVVKYYPPSLPPKGPRSSHFTARLPIDVAPGMVVHVEHHAGGHGREDCPPPGVGPASTRNHHQSRVQTPTIAACVSNHRQE